VRNLTIFVRRSAFTLVELLVVMAIIALLAGLMLPVVAAGLAAGKRSASGANLRQIGIAIGAYTHDHKGRFPSTTHGNSHEKSWIFGLASYLDEVDEVRICPADPKRPERRKGSATSYVLNEYLTVPQYGGFGAVIEDFTRMDFIDAPSEAYLGFVGSDDLPVHVTADHTHSRNWSSGWAVILKDIAPDRHRAGFRKADRSRGNANYLMADGRVQLITAADLKALSHKNPNWAKPE